MEGDRGMERRKYYFRETLYYYFINDDDVSSILFYSSCVKESFLSVCSELCILFSMKNEQLILCENIKYGSTIYISHRFSNFPEGDYVQLLGSVHS